MSVGTGRTTCTCRKICTGGIAPRVALPARRNPRCNRGLPNFRTLRPRRPDPPPPRRIVVPPAAIWAGRGRNSPVLARIPFVRNMASVVQDSKSIMLKITLLDSADECRFRLEGKLSGLWVAELRQCWKTASSTTHGRRTVMDLRDVDFVDSSGEALLCDMSGQGVDLQASTPFMQAVVDSISAAPRESGGVEGLAESA